MGLRVVTERFPADTLAKGVKAVTPTVVTLEIFSDTVCAGEVTPVGRFPADVFAIGVSAVTFPDDGVVPVCPIEVAGDVFKSVCVIGGADDTDVVDDSE